MAEFCSKCGRETFASGWGQVPGKMLCDGPKDPLCEVVAEAYERGKAARIGKVLPTPSPEVLSAIRAHTDFFSGTSRRPNPPPSCTRVWHWLAQVEKVSGEEPHGRKDTEAEA